MSIIYRSELLLSLEARWLYQSCLLVPLTMPGQRPSVGVGVIICRNDTVLIGKRLSDHGKGVRSFPGGHLEYGESLEECARRETAEEAGVEISKVHFADVTNDIFEDS